MDSSYTVSQNDRMLNSTLVEFLCYATQVLGVNFCTV